MMPTVFCIIVITALLSGIGLYRLLLALPFLDRGDD